MIAIRPEQSSAFDAYMRENFITRMAGHLRRSFPRQCDGVSEAELRARIGRAMDRAAVYEIRKERDIARFLDVGMIFGENFDTEMPWAAERLAGSTDPSVRMKLTFDEARRRSSGAHT